MKSAIELGHEFKVEASKDPNSNELIIEIRTEPKEGMPDRSLESSRGVFVTAGAGSNYLKIKA